MGAWFISRIATAAAAAIGSLALCGIDVKFDWHQGALAPTVLDLNPRPAGLMHSDLLTTDGSHREAGIASGLWRHLRRLTAGCPALFTPPPLAIFTVSHNQPTTQPALIPSEFSRCRQSLAIL